jgi:hypothetical protein
MSDRPPRPHVYADGRAVELGDLCLIPHRRGLWAVYSLGYFAASNPEEQIQRPERWYVSVTQGRHRTAVDVHTLTFCQRTPPTTGTAARSAKRPAT